MTHGMPKLKRMTMRFLPSSRRLCRCCVAAHTILLLLVSRSSAASSSSTSTTQQQPHDREQPNCNADDSASNSQTCSNNMSDPLQPVVFCGPSGVGKGTLIELLMKRFPNDQFGFSVSHTTRPPREGESDGVHYHFTTVDAIQKEIKEEKFIEYAEVHGKYYGTSIQSVESVQKSGKICVLDIDVQGVQKVKASSLTPRYIFIAPPSKDVLEKRLRGRGTETEDAIATRLSNAAKELEYGQTTGNFDRVFVNADLQECFETMVEQFKEWYPHLVEVAPDDVQKSCTSCAVS